MYFNDNDDFPFLVEYEERRVYSFPFDAKCRFKGRKIHIEVLRIKYYKQFPNGKEAIFIVRRKMDGIVMNLRESKLKR